MRYKSPNPDKQGSRWHSMGNSISKRKESLGRVANYSTAIMEGLYERIWHSIRTAYPSFPMQMRRRRSSPMRWRYQSPVLTPWKWNWNKTFCHHSVAPESGWLWSNLDMQRKGKAVRKDPSNYHRTVSEQETPRREEGKVEEAGENRGKDTQ